MLLGVEHQKGDGWPAGSIDVHPSISEFVEATPMATTKSSFRCSKRRLSYYEPDGTDCTNRSQPDDTGDIMFATYETEVWTVQNVGRLVG